MKPSCEAFEDHELLLCLGQHRSLQVPLLQLVTKSPKPDRHIFIDVSTAKEVCRELLQLITSGNHFVLFDPDCQMLAQKLHLSCFKDYAEVVVTYRSLLGDIV